MKCFAVVVLCSLVGSSLAEAPRFRSARLRSGFSARQEVEATTPKEEDAPYPAAGAPYPPSGWKPTGQAFELPTGKVDEATTPEDAYGTPVEVYGAPSSVYGPPTTPAGEETTTDLGDGFTVDPEVEIATEPPAASGRLRRLPKNQRLVQRNQEESAFYVLLPDNTLQRIEVRPSGARVNNNFNAKILQEVPQIRGPVQFVRPQNPRF